MIRAGCAVFVGLWLMLALVYTHAAPVHATRARFGILQELATVLDHVPK
jgi:hypothetical protein